MSPTENNRRGELESLLGRYARHIMENEGTTCLDCVTADCPITHAESRDIQRYLDAFMAHEEEREALSNSAREFLSSGLDIKVRKQLLIDVLRRHGLSKVADVWGLSNIEARVTAITALKRLFEKRDGRTVPSWIEAMIEAEKIETSTPPPFHSGGLVRGSGPEVVAPPPKGDFQLVRNPTGSSAKVFQGTKIPEETTRDERISPKGRMIWPSLFKQPRSEDARKQEPRYPWPVTPYWATVVSLREAMTDEPAEADFTASLQTNVDEDGCGSAMASARFDTRSEKLVFGARFV